MDENGHRYVGLVNQAKTCYLNSLIQTLYMTPEFRNAIYTWKFNGNSVDETKNITFQLQKLFLLLQSSNKSSLETTDLTASFEWQFDEAYDEHDVQELCRLMFDALEHKWRMEPGHATLIQDLYKGTMQDWLKCLKCQTERVNEATFLDLPLGVRPFGATEAHKSVEDALRAFVKPEVLHGDNQYMCERCNSKQDAAKGLRFSHFPYLLAIQLKRFDFDNNTVHKLNDRQQDVGGRTLGFRGPTSRPVGGPIPGQLRSDPVLVRGPPVSLWWENTNGFPDFSMTFPDILDLNDFIHKSAAPQPPVIKPSTMSYASAAKKKTPPPQTHWEATLADGADKPPTSQEPDKIWLNAQRDSDEVKELLAKGPYVYELFSVMVHQDSASGAHYFAYIK
ncbi:ubiquitin carboxyl-terminal hydrolase 47-like protein [Aphelenchoides avenae]|nr:ubiquitin carboxyl-terminal hydrolase 47-like protein [Aphelenchus avenae]